MAGTSWLVDSRRIATKIMSASEKCDPRTVQWRSDPTRACPNCDHVIDNSDVIQAWPGLPRGVKFDPSDQEIIWHLLAKVGHNNMKPHPFIDEFIPTVVEDDGICYTHPQNLPGVKQDGNVAHFFHRAIKAYNTGTRKRRKIHGDDQGDVRWHKTGRTKPVILDGVQRGCKKIMVLYISMARGKKPEKTNWVMHQYHLGTAEEEMDGEFVVSKVFYQQQLKPGDKVEQDLPLEETDSVTAKVDPVTPKSVIPEPPRAGKQHSDVNPRQELSFMETSEENLETAELGDDVLAEWGELNDHCHLKGEDNGCQAAEDDNHQTEENDKQIGVDDDNHTNTNLWDGDSQLPFDAQQMVFDSQQMIFDSQQMVEGLSLCDEFFQSQSPQRIEGGVGKERKIKSRLSDYGAEDLKKDLEECQSLGSPGPINNGGEKDVRPFDSGYAQTDNQENRQDSEQSQNLGIFDPSNLDLETPPDFRLSQLEFGSQDIFAWKGEQGF
ncbi:hypothetical protein MKX03_034824 [Papaver bracteatum]|nr:hypothetical protein MKX03_034824 [Papaver bracteatum]